MHQPDIDKLKHDLTYEQWCNWELFYKQDPWGELRADMRGTAHVLHILRVAKEINLMHPYFQIEEEIDEKLAELEKLNQKHDTPEHQAKLKAARLKHREAMKQKHV